MSTQRYISTSFWDDSWISEIDPSEKLVYLYLMTNPLTNIAGVYKTTIRRMCFDTGFSVEVIKTILNRFEIAKKAFFKNDRIILPSWPKHQKWESRAKIKDGIISILQDLSDENLNFLVSVNYRFDISVVRSTIISSKIRQGISGTTYKKLKEKCSNRCSKCGETEGLEVHHIKRIKDGGDNSFDNLDLLCSKCHNKQHKKASPDTIYRLDTQSLYVRNYLDSDLDSDYNLESQKKRTENFEPPNLDNEPQEMQNPTDCPPFLEKNSNLGSTTSLVSEIMELFTAHGIIDNKAKEITGAKGLIEKASNRSLGYDQTIEWVNDLLKAFLKLKESDKFFKTLPTQPSTLNSSGIFDQLKEKLNNIAKPELMTTKARAQVKARKEALKINDDEMIDEDEIADIANRFKRHGGKAQ